MNASISQQPQVAALPAHSHVLLVSDRVSLGRLLGDALADIGEGMPMAYRRRRDLSGVRREDLDTAAAILVDCRATGGGASSWRTLYSTYPGLPFILLLPDGARSDGLRAIMDGAQDFIEQADLDERRLRRAIECSIERMRVESAVSGSRDLDDMMGGRRSSMTAGLYGLGALEESLPGDHRFLVAEYCGVLKRVIDSYGQEGSSDDSKERLGELVERIGALRGTPRDLVDVHSEALRKLLEQLNAQQENAVAAEARFVLLEAMGYLAYYYRRYSVQLPF